MTTFVTSFDGGTAGATIGLTGHGGDDFTLEGNGANTSCTYDATTGRQSSGGLSALFSIGSTKNAVWRQWNPTAASDFSLRMYVYLTAHPAAAFDIAQLGDSGVARGRLRIQSNGPLAVLNGTTNVGATTTAIPLNEVVRIEATFQLRTDGTGSISADIYSGHSGTPLDSITVTGLTAGGATANQVRLGVVNTANFDYSYNTDGWGAVDSTTRLGPLQSASGALSGSGTLSATAAPTSIDAALSGSGLLSATATDMTTSAALSGSGSLSALTALPTAVTIDGALAGSGSLTATAVGEETIFLGPTETLRWRMKGSLVAAVERGLTVYRVGGQWRSSHMPSPDEIAAADRLYLGGREHPINRIDRDELIAAGFGSHIATLEVT